VSTPTMNATRSAPRVLVAGDERLSLKARKAIENPDTINYISIASWWEIAIKCSLGKLRIDTPLEEFAPRCEIRIPHPDILMVDDEKSIRNTLGALLAEDCAQGITPAPPSTPCWKSR